ncbi:MAG: NAD(P)-dependent oxidoreductase [Verrucomicrobiae bacterium]|nr:NAD(P)-dependent oxidoreductase [Verrucomicrobiae bacterium]MDD2710516.1 NAD(P)-dependent oxidoreductase [Verrucomicrobiae bacterium]
MKIKNIFLTGASGKVGRALLPELMAAGYRVRALEFEETLESKATEILKGDLRDPSLAKKALQDMDAVIHMANCKENRELFLDTNIKGTFQLLDETMRCKHIKQFIQAGSDARAGIFFNPRPYPIDENFPHAAYPGYYAFSKVLEEVMCEQYRIQYQTPITVLRFSWVHEKDDFLCHITLKEPNFGVPIWKELAKTAKQKSFFEKKEDGVAKLVHPGGKPGVRHIVGIKDVVQGVMKSIGNPAAIGHAFAITGPSAFSYDVAAEYAAKKLNLPVVEFELEGFHDFSHNISKPRSLLGYDPQYDIFKIIDEGIAFRKAGGKHQEIKYIG